MGKMLTVRVDDAILRSIDAVLDRERYATHSDFIREAIRRMVREERRNRVKAEVEKLVLDRGETAREAEIANERRGDFIERWERADRGDL